MPEYQLVDNMAAKDGEKKKSFDFRMSKKVAELTQVVHMLFTRNHEKEVEIEALRDAYEHEIGLVIKDAKERIGVLEKQVKTLEKTKGQDGADARASLDKELLRKEEEWQKRFAYMDKQMFDEKRECQNARDLLIQAQKDLEKLRQAQGDELSRKGRDLENKNKDLERCKQTIITLERRLKDADCNANSNLHELRRENDKLRNDLTSVHGNLAENERLREQLAARNKQLESELRAMKKELVKRAERSGRSSAQSRPEIREPGPVPEYMEELERLRREVARYRNELCNREENFNRMFTQQHPVVVDKRAGKMAFGMSETAAANLRYAMTAREGTFMASSYPTSAGHQLVPGKSMGAPHSAAASQSSNSRPGSGIEERELMSPVPNLTVTVSNANVFFAPPHPPAPTREELNFKGLHGTARHTQTITARLPQLGLEARRQAAAGGGARLAKPRPLPREMLSAKAGVHG